MLHAFLEEELQKAKHAFKEATGENIIELCEKYLILLNEFRSELNKFRGKSEINLQQANSSLREEVLAKRKEIHVAITDTVQELNRTTALFHRLTSANGSETAATFNKLNYKGYKCWEFRGGKVKFRGGSEKDEIPIQEAVDIAIRLRCEEFVLPNVVRTESQSEGK